LSAPLPVVTDASASPAPHGHKPLGLGIDPRAYERGLGCVHCGLCLPACPTYTQNGHEGDSPRGRIQLMLGLAEGKIEPTPSVRKHLDLCLDCRGCETACPSGVVYHELLEETRGRLAQTQRQTAQDRFMRWLFFNVFVHPTRLKLALLPARLMQKAGLYGLLRKTGLLKLLPPQLRKMEQMLPDRGRLWPKALPEHVRGTGASPVAAAGEHGPVGRATTVGFFAGCIGSVMFDDVNRMAVELLAACGADVVAPRAQGCCGAIHHHNGAHEPAVQLAKRNIDTFLPQNGDKVDFVATSIAGCGAMLREYDVLLRDDPQYAARAKEFAKRVRDVSEVLAELNVAAKLKYPVNETVTYHDACHLAHAQKVVAQPRALLAAIPGIKLVALPESDMCCGAAGTYNLQHPEMATELAKRKLRNIASTGAATCATGNVGCAMHIGSEARAYGEAVRVVHPVELLHRSVRLSHFSAGGTGVPEQVKPL
jgi:glycolate oxidase iron-sulfur subunit